MLFTHCGAFLRCRIVPDATGPANISYVRIVDDGVVVDDGLVDVGVADDGPIYPHHGGVIGKLAAAPLAADKADAHVAKAVIHTAIVADVVAPVAVMEYIKSVGPAPVTWRPQRALKGCRNPGAGNPVIAVVAIGPVARRPHQAGLRAKRLFVNGKNGRSESNADKDTSVGGSGDQADKQRQQEPARGAE
jgi:hypothetical protein